MVFILTATGEKSQHAVPAACCLCIATRQHLWARSSSALESRQKVCYESRGRLALWPFSQGLVNTEFSKYLQISPRFPGQQRMWFCLLPEKVNLIHHWSFPLNTVPFISLQGFTCSLWAVPFLCSHSENNNLPGFQVCLLLVFRNCESKSSFTYKPFIIPLILVMVCRIYTRVNEISTWPMTGAP